MSFSCVALCFCFVPPNCGVLPVLVPMGVKQLCCACRKGAWQEVVLPLDRFLLTHKGRLVETRSEMNPHRIVSLGISLAAGGSDAKKGGAFCLGLECIKATRAGS